MKQNHKRILLILGVLILIPTVSVISITGYYLIQRSMHSDDPAPWEKNARPRSSSTDEKTSAPPLNAANNSTTGSGNPGKTSGGSKNNLESEANKFFGQWTVTDSITGVVASRDYSKPQLVNGEYVGTIIDESGSTFAEYTISPGNKMTHKILVGNAFNQAGDLNVYSFKFENNGRKLILTKGGVTYDPWLRK